MRLTLGPLLYIFLIPVLAFKHGSRRERRKVVVEYLLLGASYAVMFSFAPLAGLLYGWLLPLLLVGQMTAIRGFRGLRLEVPRVAGRSGILNMLSDSLRQAG